MAMKKGTVFIYPEEGRIDRLLKGGVLKKNIGTIGHKGYSQVEIEGKKDRVHRVIWSYVNGPIPNGMVIDHINGDKSDNRISNLRLATCSQNSQNRIGPQANSKSKVKGVSFVPRLNKFEAAIQCNRKKVSVGFFESIDEANQAYCIAASKIHTHNPSAFGAAA
jgi:hypothetical protein